MSSVRNRSNRTGGFTLIEVLVAITLLGLVAAAILPLLIIGARSSVLVRHETLAKNLVQERLEQMRQLPFQVDRQNGPFIDLLDYYYPGRTPVAASASVAGWVSATSTARSAKEPATGSFYRVVVPQVPGQPAFKQVITAQFLRGDRSPVPDGTFTTYNSQVAGTDGPPSAYLGINVITTWSVGGRLRESAVYTEISNPGTSQSLITSQAQATAVQLSSTDPLGVPLGLVASRVSAEGRLSDGSTAAVRAIGAEGTYGSASPLRGSFVDAAQPGSVVSGTLSAGAQRAVNPGCGYAAFGSTENTNIAPSVTGGLPRLPATVGTTATTPAVQARASIVSNAGGDCGSFTFNNLSTSYDSTLRLTSGSLVRMPIVTSSAAATDASAWLNASTTTASPRFVSAGAGASTGDWISLLPVDFAADGRGLLTIKLNNAAITCSTNGTPVTATYSMAAEVYKSIDGSTPARSALFPTFTWTSGGAAPPTVDLEQVVYRNASGTELKLKDYFSDITFATAVATAPTTGAASIDAVMRLVTKPLRSGADQQGSGIELRLGALGCTAADAR